MKGFVVSILVGIVLSVVAITVIKSDSNASVKPDQFICSEVTKVVSKPGYAR